MAIRNIKRPLPIAAPVDASATHATVKNNDGSISFTKKTAPVPAPAVEPVKPGRVVRKPVAKASTVPVVAPVAKPATKAAPTPKVAQVPAIAMPQVKGPERHGLDRYAPTLPDGTSPLLTVDGEKCRTELRVKPRRDGALNYADSYLVEHFRTRYGSKTFRRGALDAGRLNRLIDREFVAVNDKGKDITTRSDEFRPCDPDQLFRVLPKVKIAAVPRR